MRVLPPNWEGIHPAYPARTAPFNESSLTNAPIWAGGVGVITAGISLVFRRSPSAGLKTAAWTTILYGVPTVGLEAYAGRSIAKPYLESKGVNVPKQNIIDRPLNIDGDNYVLAGGLLGVGFAASVRKPWAIFGWQRWLGAFSIGAFAGTCSKYGYYWNQLDNFSEISKRNQAQRLMWKEDVKRFIESQAFAESSPKPENGKAPGMTSLQDMLKSTENMQSAHNAMMRDMHAAAEKAAQKEQEEDIDEQDPQPHYSEMRDTERVFFPEPNYKWQPGSDGVQQVDQHIQKLKDRRTRLADEASLLFHTLASKQNELYRTEIGAPEREQRRVNAELIAHLHTQTYLEISRLDWCIADSQKTKLQLQALAKNQHWLPTKPSKTPTLTHSLRLLDDFDHENEVARTEMDLLAEQANSAMQDPGLTAMDMSTGQVVENPYSRIQKDMEELRRVQKESDMIREAIAKMRKEMGGEKKDD